MRRVAIPGAVGQSLVATAARRGGRRAAFGWGWSAGARLRPGHLGRQHGRADPRAGRQPRPAHADRPHRRRLAGRRGPVHRPRARAAAGAVRRPRPAARRRRRWRSALAALKIAALVAFTFVRRRARHPVAARPRRRDPLARAVHAHRAGRGPGHRGRVGASCSACRWRWARSWPAWWSAGPSSACGRRPTRCRCATPSPCCSSSRSGCCSTRGYLLDAPRLVAGDAGDRPGRQAAGGAGDRPGCCGYPFRVALAVAVALAQIGEFSFILADARQATSALLDDGRHEHPRRGRHRLDHRSTRSLPAGRAARARGVAARPRLWRVLIRAAARRGRRRSPPHRRPDAAHRAVVVGYGPVGRTRGAAAPRERHRADRHRDEPGDRAAACASEGMRRGLRRREPHRHARGGGRRHRAPVLILEPRPG